MYELHIKKEKLEESLSKLGKIAVAFSGGVDSTFLLDTANKVLNENVIAVTGRSAAFPERESDEAASFCRSIGVRQETVTIDQMTVPGFRENRPDRCYLCKKTLFTAFLKTAEKNGFSILAEGSNADDVNDYRPGMIAISELGVLSPLREAGLSKEDIRTLSKEAGLPTWSKPSLACLATRIPYGDEITEDKLSLIDKAEQFLFDLGLSQVRVRLYGNTVRIETDPSQFGTILDPETAKLINGYISGLGVTYVTLDLGGYRTGSMNLVLSENEKMS